MKNIKVEWCENFIRAAFGKRHHALAGNPRAGIEVNYFWKRAEAAGLWEPNTYGGPMSQALEKLVNVDCVFNDQGDFLYYVYRLK